MNVTWTSVSRWIAGLHILATIMVVGRGYFFVDDYVLIARSLANPLLSHDHLLTEWAGTLTPGGMVLNYLLAHHQPFNYLAVVAVVVCAQIIATLALRQASRRMFGNGVAHVVPVAIYCTSVAVFAAASWWTVAMALVPMQAALALAIWAVAGRPNVANTCIALGACAAGLFFSDLAVLFPIALVGLLWANGKVLRTYVPLVVGSVALSVGYLAFLTTVAKSTDPLPAFTWPVTISDAISRSGSTTATAAFGGPWKWTETFEILSNAGPFQVTIAAMLLVAGVLVGVYRGGPKALRWPLVCGGYVAGKLVFTLTGPAGLVSILQIAPRLHADTILVLACAAGGLTATSFGTRARQPFATSTSLTIAVAGIVVLATSSLYSLSGYVPWLDRNPQKPFAATAVSSIKTAKEGVVILDTTVPGSIVSELLDPLNRVSALFGKVPSQARIASQAEDFMILSFDGRLYPGTVVGTSAQAGTSAGCGWRLGSDTTIPLIAPTVGNAARLTYRASRPATLRVSLGEGPTRTVELTAGSHATSTILGGSGSGLRIRNDGDADICVSELVVGSPSSK